MLPSRKSYVVLNNELRRWRKQKNGLPQGSVLSPVWFSIYTNDQHIYTGTWSFIYADDLCDTAQYPFFIEVEETIEDALEEITQYYRSNSLRANPDKTQVSTFHLRNKDEKRSLKVKWSNTATRRTLDHILSCKQHIHNTKMKMTTRNNLLLKLANSRCGTSVSTIRNTALALCYSVAEYAAPVWARSHHAHVLDS